jgi:Protein of unknown function (DUF3631)
MSGSSSSWPHVAEMSSGVWEWKVPEAVAAVAVRESSSSQVSSSASSAVPFTGAEILDIVRTGFLEKYASFPHCGSVVTALWAAHTHFKIGGVLRFRVTPRLFVFSSVPASGKSTVLELLNLICPDTHGLDVDPTQYGLQYTLGKEHATVLLDEGDVSAVPGRVIAIVNAGYTEGGSVLNGRGSAANRVPVFGPIALGALDTIETGRHSNSLRALLTRGITVRMVPACRGSLARWGAVTEDEGSQCRAALAWWASQNMDLVRDHEPDMSGLGLSYREEQIWGPLFTVADLAGGAWPGLAREAARKGGQFPEGSLFSWDTFAPTS